MNKMSSWKQHVLSLAFHSFEIKYLYAWHSLASIRSILSLILHCIYIFQLLCSLLSVYTSIKMAVWSLSLPNLAEYVHTIVTYICPSGLFSCIIRLPMPIWSFCSCPTIIWLLYVCTDMPIWTLTSIIWLLYACTEMPIWTLTFFIWLLYVCRDMPIWTLTSIIWLLYVCT